MAASNPPDGALIDYWLKSKPAEKDEVKITIADSAGALVREIKGPKEKGLNQASWDLRLEPPAPPAAPAGETGFPPPRGPLVTPGTYTVKVALGAASATSALVVEEDPRIKIGASERREWEITSREAAKVFTRADGANRAVTALKKQLADAQDSLKTAPEEVKTAITGLTDSVNGLARRLNRQEPLGFAGAPLAEDPDPLLPRARSLYFAIGGITAAPTPSQREALARVQKQVDEVVGQVNELVETKVPEANRMLMEKGIGRLEGAKRIP